MSMGEVFHVFPCGPLPSVDSKSGSSLLQERGFAPKVSAVSAVAHAHLLSDSRALSNGRYASCDMVT